MSPFGPQSGQDKRTGSLRDCQERTAGRAQKRAAITAGAKRPPSGAAGYEGLRLDLLSLGKATGYLLAKRSAIGPMMGSLKYLPFRALTAQSTHTMIQTIQKMRVTKP